MKKTLRAISITLILASFVLLLSACGTKLSGTYTASGLISQSYTFDNDGNVTYAAAGVNLVTGTYKIAKGKITFSFDTDDILSLGGNSLALNHAMTFQKKGNTIFLDGVKYMKE